MNQYTEDSLVQQTTANYLADQLGWESAYAYNNESFGVDGLLGRMSDKEVVLVRYLRQQLSVINPGLPVSAYDDAVRQVATVMASQTMLATNREKYQLIKEGVQVTFRNAKGELDKQRLMLIDFNRPDNNHFLCVRELWVKGDLYRRRVDIAGFVNGLPLLFIECKNIHKNLRTAFEKNFSDYKDTIPHLFHHNAIVMFANGINAKIGSISSQWAHFHEWKRLDEDDPGVVDMQTLLKGVCSKANFLDILENFIIFDDSSGETRKIVARNHQVLGVNRAIEAVKDRKNRQGKLGVFWHTQGAGKSYSIAFFTQKVHRKLGGNYTFLILTDREDLDTQIYKTFAGCGLADNDKSPCRAASGKHLNQLLQEHKAYIFSLIQKFNQKVEPEQPYTERDDVIVITDEAHRTQYGTLALNMRNALKNASFIGFTGTPLFNDDQITRRVFGDYVSTYDFSRAVEDKATVPLYYDARGEKLGIAIDDMNERIAEKLEEWEAEGIEEQLRLEKELMRDYHVITAGKRLDQIARDFVEHYSNAWETGKAMLVCIDKITCVRMHKLIEFYWQERIKALQINKNKHEDEQEHIFRKRWINWMAETQMAVVISEEQGEVDKFRKWDLDIIPHRKLIKEGMELPESMRQKPEYINKQRMPLDDAFKAQEHPFRIVIVCAMWLTGFDVPSLSTLYLDKPLKAHTLMQAIARANRVNEGKNNGLVVDYCGILKNLRKALATFTGKPGDDRKKDPLETDDRLLDDLAEAISYIKAILKDKGASLDAMQKAEGFERIKAIDLIKEAVNENDESRKRFEVMCRSVFKIFKACINNKGINQYRADYDAINFIYKCLQEDREHADISAIIKQLHEVIDDAIEVDENRVKETQDVYDISNIDFERLRKEFERSQKKHTTVQSLRQAIEMKLQRLLDQNPMRTNYQQRFEEIIAEYNREKDRVTIEKTFETLVKFIRELDEEKTRAVKEDLDEESLAIFDLLKKTNLKPNEIKQIKKVAVGLLELLKEKIAPIDHWKEGESTRDAVRLEIKDFLWQDETGLPVDVYNEEEVKTKAENVFLHIFRAYPTVPSPIYSVNYK